MTKLFPATLAVAAILAFSPAFAEDHGSHAADAAPAAVEAAADAAAEVSVMEYTLADGKTKVSVEGDKVFVVAEDGTKTAAPDGDHATTAEGVVLKVKDGMLVKEEAVEEVAPAAETTAE